MTVPPAPATQIVNLVGSIEEKVKLPKSNSIVRWWELNFKILLSEFVSTFLLVFLGCMSCIPLEGFDVQPPMYTALGFGLVVLFNITAFGHISFAHMNPSVTLSAIIWGQISIPLGIMYVIAQCSGAVLGYGMLVIVSPIDLAQGSVCATLPHPNHEIYQALLIEIILSLSLGFINCGVWDPVNKDKNDAIPLKFGFTIAGLSIAGGPLTGASMNPARTLGPSVWTGNWTAHWIYWVGPLLGGAFAPLLYKFVWLEKEKKDEQL